MPTCSDTITTPARDAATVIILRDGLRGLEVFLVKRHSLSDVLGGTYVFPGGKLDASDSQLDPQAHLDQGDALLHAALAEAQLTLVQARALFVAALREAFEECGVLFAQAVQHPQCLQLAEQIKGGLSFNQVLGHGGLRLQTSALLPWSRWITPKTSSVSRKRFDTRFFVAALPDRQIARHDNVETTESVWLTPRAALQQYWERGIELAPPQLMTLAHLARFPDVDSVLHTARQTPPPLIEPEHFEDGSERAICYPGDMCHSLSARAMPGPTRLLLRNQRFEPALGFEGLFA